MDKADAGPPDFSVDQEIAALARLLWYAKGEALSLGKTDTAALISTAILALRSESDDSPPNSAGARPVARFTSWIAATRRKLS